MIEIILPTLRSSAFEPSRPHCSGCVQQRFQGPHAALPSLSWSLKHPELQAWSAYPVTKEQCPVR